MASPADRPRDRRLRLLAVGWRSWRAATGLVGISDAPPALDTRGTNLSVEQARAAVGVSAPVAGPAPRGDGSPDDPTPERRHPGGRGGRAPARPDHPQVPRPPRLPDAEGAEFVTCEGREVSVTMEVMCAPGPRYPSPAAPEVRLAGLPVAQTARGLEVYAGRVTASLIMDGVPCIPVLAALRRLEDGRRPDPPAADHPRVRGVTCRPRR